MKIGCIVGVAGGLVNRALLLYPACVVVNPHKF